MAALVQQGTPVEATAGGSPLVFNISLNGITAGNLVVVTVELRDGDGNVVGGSGSLNGSYTEAPAVTLRAGLLYKENSAGGNETVTVEVTAPNNQTCYAQISEWSGIVTSSALDQSASDTNGGSVTSHPAGAGFTTSGAGLIIGCGALGGARTGTPATGFTALNEGTADANRYIAQYKISTGSESTTGAFTTDTGVNSHCVLAAFKDAAGGGTAVPVFKHIYDLNG